MKKVMPILIALLLVFSLSACGRNTADSTERGSVIFTVVDGITGLPIEGARVVLPENKCEFTTDDLGKTEEMNVEVSRDDRYTYPQEYGTFSVLAFKEGYSDYALFYAQIRPGEKRNMKIFMFSSDSPLSKGLPIAIIESPDDDWVGEYIVRNK